MDSGESVFTVEIDPHMYCGIALDADEETIPFAVAQRLRMDGGLTLWKFQSGWNHHHPALRGLSEIRNEIETFKLWEQTLSERFPDELFVIEQRPFDSMTWYQPTADAPAADEENWEPAHTFREISATEFLALLKAQVSPMEVFAQFRKSSREQSETEAEQRVPINIRIHPEHRGVQIATDSVTGETVALATRTIRTLIGPKHE